MTSIQSPPEVLARVLSAPAPEMHKVVTKTSRGSIGSDCSCGWYAESYGTDESSRSWSARTVREHLKAVTK
jgi:hypothetical protein